MLAMGDVPLETPDEQILKLQTRLKHQCNLIRLMEERVDRGRENLRHQETSTEPDTSTAGFENDISQLQCELESERKRADDHTKLCEDLKKKLEDAVRSRDSYRERVGGLVEITLQQRLECNNSAVQPAVEDKNDSIRTLKAQIDQLSIEVEKKQTTEKIALKGHENEQQTAQLKTSLKKRHTELQQKNLEVDRERRERIALEKYLSILRNDFEKLQTEVGKRSYITSALRDEIAERGEKLAEKDRIIAHLKEDVQGWRKRLSDSIEKFYSKSTKVDVNEKVSNLTDEIIGLNKKLQEADRRHIALKTVSEISLLKERERSSILRNAKSIGDLIILQNKIGSTFWTDELNPKFSLEIRICSSTRRVQQLPVT